jgi:hypothetical protein
MASPGSLLYTEYTELVTTTLRNTKKEFADNVSNHNALFRRLTRKNKIRTTDGGLSISCPLEYAENGTFTRYSGLDVLNIAQSDVLTTAEYPWRSCAVNVVTSGEELRKNSGGNAILNLAKSRIKVAQKTMANNLSNDIYSDGSLSNQINGIQALVADTPTNTVGNISSNTWAFWKNIVQSAAAPLQGGGAITPSATTVLSLMNPLWYELTRGADQPDFIVSSTDYFTFFEDSQINNQRYAKSEDADVAFTSMKYKGADVFFDQTDSGIPAAHMYFLNTDYLEFCAHEDAFMEVMDDKTAVNQDGVVIPIITQGNLTVSNRSLQGVLKA